MVLGQPEMMVTLITIVVMWVQPSLRLEGTPIIMKVRPPTMMVIPIDTLDIPVDLYPLKEVIFTTWRVTHPTTMVIPMDTPIGHHYN